MLADHVAQEQSGKLYVNGGAIEFVGVQPNAKRLPPLWLVIRLGFPWRLTSGSHIIEVRILDQDEKPVGGDPFARAEAQIGKPPGAEPGDEFGLNIALPLGGFEATDSLPSKVIFHLIVNGSELATMPLRLSPLVASLGVAR